MIKQSLLCSLLLFIVASAHAVRNEIDRYRLLDDKMRLDRVFRPLGHDFYIDANVAANKNIKDVIDEGKAAADTTGTADQAAAIAAFLNKYVNTEHFVNAHVGAGFPLPSFNIGTINMQWDVRGRFDLGASLSIDGSNESITVGTQTFDVPDPFIQIYLKQDYDYGLHFLFSHRSKWFFEWDAYYRSRWDRIEAVTQNTLVSDKKVLELNKAKNTTTYIMSDVRLGKTIGNFSWWVAGKDLVINQLSDSKNFAANVGGVVYGKRPLLHAHFAYKIVLPIILDLTPFVGIHRRSGYTEGDGLYAGVDTDLGWFPLTVNAIIDRYYFTLTPRFRLWFLQVEYSLKAPVKSKVDGFKTETIQELNVRLAF